MPRESAAARREREARERQEAAEARARQLLALDTQVSIGPPFLPYGASMTVSCKLGDAAEVMDVLHKLAREMEPHWRLLPHEVPAAEHVPGGSPADASDHMDYGDRARVGFRP